MCGTDLAYYPAIMYAMCDTDLAFCLTIMYAMCGTDLGSGVVPGTRSLTWEGDVEALSLPSPARTPSADSAGTSLPRNQPRFRLFQTAFLVEIVRTRAKSPR